MVTEKMIDVKVVSDSWFEDYDKPREASEDLLPIFEMKLKDGQIARTEEILFLTDGAKKTTRFGEAIVFNINHDKVDKVWFIKKTQYNLLNPIAKERKSKGTIVGRIAVVQRAGEGKSDTKWSIQFK